MVHKGLLSEQGLFVFYVIFVWNTTIYRTNGCALRLFVKAHALRTFIGYYIVDLITYRLLGLLCVHCSSVGLYQVSGEICSVCITPIVGTLINGSVWALWLTGAAIDTFVGNYDRHSIFFF